MLHAMRDALRAPDMPIATPYMCTCLRTLRPHWCTCLHTATAPGVRRCSALGTQTCDGPWQRRWSAARLQWHTVSATPRWPRLSLPGVWEEMGNAPEPPPGPRGDIRGRAEPGGHGVNSTPPRPRDA